MENDYHFAFKVVVVGDPGVGKTSLVIRHTTEQDGGAVPKILPGKQSVGINFRNKTYLYDGKTYRVQFWDAPGAERYMKLTARYCAGTAAAIFVYDVHSQSSLDHIEDWISRLQQSETIVKVLVGNMADSEDRKRTREVSQDKALAFAQKHNMEYFETSALTGMRVDDAFNAAFTKVSTTSDKIWKSAPPINRGIYQAWNDLYFGSYSYLALQ
eukprot:TRINITY_DN5196_c0_g2_i1.p1 TRINITY_DN5196_c0_g2~~TRINITY_DN5196_c0_g2_i1.p1  ORF type:complete len:213 (+),score=42.96 TRINITY_DN5196_c0_g2_i1:122-760(+)